MITISTVVLEKKKIEPEFRKCKGTQYGLIKPDNRAVGICLQVGGQDPKWGGKRQKFGAKSPIFKQFW